jgi:hypothetical protein
VINFDDYALIDLAFNTQTPGGLRAVPEAGSVSIVLAIAASSFVRRRSRRSATQTVRITV